MTETWVKICGVTTVADALMVADAGASAIGLNFAPDSPRCITLARAKEIAAALEKRVELVGVFVDASIEDLLTISREVGLKWVQLHGNEQPERLVELTETAISNYKALRIGDATDVELAATFPGKRLLVDTKVEGKTGGTGKTFDWSLVANLKKDRQLILAGGLNPSNVAEAVKAVGPFGVDTASGVETSPGKKSPKKVRDFIERARAAGAEAE